MQTFASKESRSRSAWVIGGGSGIGRAVAEHLARRGWCVAISGRGAARLEWAVRELSRAGVNVHAAPCDVTSEAEVITTLDRLALSIGQPSLIVHCAGINVRKRHWSELDAATAHHVINVNLGGVVNTLSASVPRLRDAGGGTLVVVSSWAGWRPTRFTGPAYSAAKTALSPLVESINEEQGGFGLRATLVCPAEVNTEILEQRAAPPATSDRERMLQPRDVADAVLFAAEAPAHVCINEIVISPLWNRIYREPERLSETGVDGCGPVPRTEGVFT